MPLMALDGLDTGALMSGSPLTRDADPEHVDAFLAAVTVYMAGNLDAPPPPGCTPALRHHQHHMAGAFLAMLADRRGWAGPDRPTVRRPRAPGARVGITRAGGPQPAPESKDPSRP